MSRGKLEIVTAVALVAWCAPYSWSCTDRSSGNGPEDAGPFRDVESIDADLPESPDAGRTDADEVSCRPKSICTSEGCRLDIAPPERIEIEPVVDWNDESSEDANGNLVFASAETGADDLDEFRDRPGRSVYVDTALTDAGDALEPLSLFAGTFDVYWVENGTVRPRLLRDDLELQESQSIRFRPHRAPTFMLSLEVRLRGEPLEHWVDREKLSSDKLEVGGVWWKVRIEDEQSSFRAETRIGGDESSADIELAPSTYDISVDPFASAVHHQADRRVVQLPLTGDAVPGAVHGWRRVADDLEVQGDRSLTVDLEPVEVDVRPSTRKLGKLVSDKERWALRFVDEESGRLFSQRADFGADNDSTWMYPGNYRVWLQSYRDFRKPGQIEPAFERPRDEAALLANEGFRAEPGAALDLNGEAVEWELHARLDGRPLDEWNRDVDADDPASPDWRVMLVGSEQPRGAMMNRWVYRLPVDQSTASLWTPPGDYDMYPSFVTTLRKPRTITPVRYSSVRIAPGARETISIDTSRVSIQFQSHGRKIQSTRLARDAYWSVDFIPERSQIDPNGPGLQPIRFPGLGDDASELPTEARVADGSYRLEAEWSYDDAYPVARDGGASVRFSMDETWRPREGELTIDLPNRILEGRVAEHARTKIEKEHSYDEHWHLRLDPRNRSGSEYRSFEGAEPTYRTQVRSGVYDVYFAPWWLYTHGEEPIEPPWTPLDWRVARCVRIE